MLAQRAWAWLAARLPAPAGRSRSSPAPPALQLCQGDAVAVVVVGDKPAEPRRAPASLDSSSHRPVCRVCLEPSGELISPCACRGTCGFVHASCLEAWCAEAGSLACELCQQPWRDDLQARLAPLVAKASAAKAASQLRAAGPQAAGGAAPRLAAQEAVPHERSSRERLSIVTGWIMSILMLGLLVVVVLNSTRRFTADSRAAVPGSAQGERGAWHSARASMLDRAAPRDLPAGFDGAGLGRRLLAQLPGAVLPRAGRGVSNLVAARHS